MASSRVASRFVSGALLVALSASFVATSGRALAAEPGADGLERAHDAYDRGVAAFHRGDFRAAAREFSTADELAPNATALGAAIDAALRADDAAFGMELVARALRVKGDDKLDALRADAEKRFHARVGRVRFACEGATACAATIDERAVDPRGERVVEVGSHAVRLTRDGESTARAIDVKSGAVIEIAIDPKAPSVPGAATRTRAEPSRAWLVALAAGGIATLGLGVASLASGVDTASQHDTFGARGCAKLSGPGCFDLQTRGRAAELRTNVLAGVTAGVVVVGTVVTIALFKSRNASATLGLGPTRATLGAVF